MRNLDKVTGEVFRLNTEYRSDFNKMKKEAWEDEDESVWDHFIMSIPTPEELIEETVEELSESDKIEMRKYLTELIENGYWEVKDILEIESDSNMSIEDLAELIF